VRLLLFSDLHLDAPGTETSTVELRSAFARIGELAQDLKVDAVCSAGNLYDHQDLAADTADVLWKGFAGINPIPVFLVPGSSDWYSPSSLYAKPWSNNVHVFTQAHLTSLSVADGVTLWGAAHIAPTQALGFLGTPDLRPAGVNLALFHGCERAEFTAQQMSGPLTAPFHAHQIRQSGFDHALVGHLPVPKEEPDFTYPGRPLPHRPDGPRTGGAVLLTVHSDGSVDREWFELFDRSPYAKGPERPAVVSQDNHSDDAAPVSPGSRQDWAATLPPSPAPSPAPAFSSVAPTASSYSGPSSPPPRPSSAPPSFSSAPTSSAPTSSAPTSSAPTSSAPASSAPTSAAPSSAIPGSPAPYGVPGPFSKGPDSGPPPWAPPPPAEEADPYDTPEYAESTVRGQFIRSIRRGELSRADQNRVLAIGLAAIDGQEDFGEL